MIVRFSKSGASFRGAGWYYLHDKAASRDMPNALKPKTDERVWFTDTRNSAHIDPERALDEMWATAEMANELKRVNGISTAGRKVKDPVKTFSLNWHPSEQVTPEHMVEAADAFLEHMGWDEHQAVYIGHRDTEHRHIHVVLNRVHPETGRALDERNDYKRAQEWALAYEKEHGRIFCAARLDPSNDNTRDLPHTVVEMSRPAEKAFLSEEARREAQDKLERDLLKAQQRHEREAFFDDGRKVFKDLRDGVYREVREEYKEHWRTFYKERDEAMKAARAFADAETERAFEQGRAANWDTAWQTFDRRGDRVEEVARAFAERAKALREAQLAETRECQDQALEVLREQRDNDYLDLKRRQQEERDEMRAAHATGARASHLLHPTYEPSRANDNTETAFPYAATPGNRNDPAWHAAQRQAPEPRRTIEDILGLDPQPAAEPDPATRRAADETAERDAARDRAASVGDPPETVKQGADLAAGAIGSVASYLADQLAEAFAPTPPEVREARARAEAKREAEQPIVEEKDKNPFARFAEAAIKRAEAERARDRDYWDERERRRDR